MTDQEKIEAFIREHGVTLCPPAYAHDLDPWCGAAEWLPEALREYARKTATDLPVASN